MNERWRKVVGWPLYSVSDQGRVRRDSTGRVLKQAIVNRYPWVNLSVNGKLWKGHVHTLVLTAFVGPPSFKQQCRHKDGNNQNNWLTNLCWGTAKENSDDRARHGHTVNGERVHTAVLSRVQVRQIRALLKTNTVASLARQFDVGTSTISAIKHNQSWRH